MMIMMLVGGGMMLALPYMTVSTRIGSEAIQQAEEYYKEKYGT